jgi:PAS domain S-box-containing protein
MPVRGTDGKVSVLVTIQNITEKKLIEQALKENRDRSADLVETVEEWIWELYPNGIFKFTSGKAKEFLGYEPVEFSGKSFLDFLMPNEIERISSILRDAFSGQKPIVSLHHVCRHRDGHPVECETSGKPFFDEAGILAGYRCISKEISYRRKSERDEQAAS